MRQLTRCFALCDTLSNENVGLCEHWKNIFSTVKNDLEIGTKVLVYLHGTCGNADSKLILKSRKLNSYISGLAEFVGIVRSITASIGDLLCLDESVDIQAITLSEWSNHFLIANAIEVEDLWSVISSKAEEMGIFSQQIQLERVSDIRARVLSSDCGKKDEFCQLTLQPLDDTTNGSRLYTRTPVIWSEKKYMACAANFWANKMV